ncbi:ParB/RepB/Spo0J family partition protein [Pseudoruegeria sp. SK021]|uniref:ParB/RepB/Spo0J family partition protein n=1 Tax=Pseudoruegeria sp. SK021 TaxID=1933035 RepID=UPI0026A4E204
MADVGMHDSAETHARVRPETVLAIEQIAPNPDQPRRTFTEENLRELAESIRTKGVLQPLIVRRKVTGQAQFQIVAGERRWRAAQIAQLHELPVVVRELSDVEVLEIAIIENIQRADLNPVEEAAGFRQLMDRFGHTQEKLAEALGKSRSHIANLLRLLQLPEDVLQMLVDGRLSAGHARALITTEDPIGLARIVIAKGLSVRETERLARDEGAKKSAPTETVTNSRQEKDADTRVLEQDLAANLGMKVSISQSSGRESGTVTIAYGSFDQLDELCRVLSLSPTAGTI